MKKWQILSDVIPKDEDEVIDFLLKNRGIKTKKQREEFLNPKLEKVNLKTADIDKQEVLKSIKRIKKAIENSEKIVIYGDYDVDGITGTAVLWETLYTSYRNVIPFIPHRIEEGYGISVKGIDSILKKTPDAKLIITVDNGIVAGKAITYAKEKGIDVIVTDHHAKSDLLPGAYSIVHTTKLCGAGVAFMLALAFEGKDAPGSNDDRLSLVALATVADLVPLVEGSRALVKYGIEALKKTKRPGIIALLNGAGVKKEEIDTYKIGHIIAPRLNAAGRIGHAMDGLRLICTKDLRRGAELANELSMTNKTRQLMTVEGAELADKISSQIILKDDFIVVHDKSYNEGIIGLIASRIVEKHYRPAIVISEGETYSKGSARSISGFNIIEFIREHSELLVDVGGHPMAAGFTIETAKIKLFREALVKRSVGLLTKELLERKLDIDMEIDLKFVTTGLLRKINRLAPFGMKNPEPIFLSTGLSVKDVRLLGKENQHVKLLLSSGEAHLEAIFFRGAGHNIKPETKLDVVYMMEENKWNGSSKAQLKIIDIRESLPRPLS